MRITIRQQLSIAVPTAGHRALFHLLVTPVTGPTQAVREWSVEMPGFTEAASFIDGFGNRARLVSLAKPEPELTLILGGVVETTDRNGVLGRPSGEPMAAVYRRVTAATKPFASYADPLRDAPRDRGDRISLLHNLMAVIGEKLSSDAVPSQTQSQNGQSQEQTQRPTEIALTRTATDYAHAFIGAARSLGVPARFVSGYFAGDDDLPAGAHAWCEAWDDGLGWIGFDPLLNLCPTDRHVRVASGLDAGSTPQVRAVPVIAAPTVTELSVTAD